LLAALVAAVTILRPAPTATEGAAHDSEPEIPSDAQVAFSEAA
jgi:hypothetical protein